MKYYAYLDYNRNTVVVSESNIRNVYYNTWTLITPGTFEDCVKDWKQMMAASEVHLITTYIYDDCLCNIFKLHTGLHLISILDLNTQQEYNKEFWSIDEAEDFCDNYEEVKKAIELQVGHPTY